MACLAKFGQLLFTEDTLLSHLVNSGANPLKMLCEKPSKDKVVNRADGVVDSLRYLLFQEIFIKPWSHEHLLTTFLTKAF